MIEGFLKDEVQSAIQSLYSLHVKTDDIAVSVPAQKENGDFSTNISFSLAGKLKKKPNDIASELAAQIKGVGMIKAVKAASGFLNFYLDPSAYRARLAEIIAAGKDYGRSDQFSGKKIQLEFISANPTGPLTLANGRGGYGGDVLANLFQFAGATVEREYYVNDGGNQVRILGLSVLKSAGLIETDEDTYKGDYIDDMAGGNKKLVSSLADDPFTLGRKMAAELLEERIRPSVRKMGIRYDNWFSEFEMIERGEVDEAIKKLKKYGHTYEEGGALWMKTTDFGDDKDRVLVKSDGEKTYFANDVAYHYDKLYVRKFEKIIDIWGADHHGYVGRMMAAVAAMDCPGALSVVITQMVRLIKDGKEFKMSKRAGTYVSMNDLFELIGPDGPDVARFFFLSRSFNTHMDFDLDLAKDRSEKNPVFYVKYAGARINGIIANASKDIKAGKPKLELLTAPEELELIAGLSELPAIIATILGSNDYPIHHLTFYIQELARKFHHFYDKCRVIDEDNIELSRARMALVGACGQVLSIVGEDLIGIEIPKKM